MLNKPNEDQIMEEEEELNINFFNAISPDSKWSKVLAIINKFLSNIKGNFYCSFIVYNSES
jgi:hypothetical protein